MKRVRDAGLGLGVILGAGRRVPTGIDQTCKREEGRGTLE
jgi:hypothetical protein